MKKFVFSLQKLKDFRERACLHEEASLERLLGVAQNLDARQAALVSQAFAQPQPVAERSDLAAMAQYRAFARREQVKLESEKAVLAKSITGQRHRLVEARKNAEILSQLRDDRLNAWRREADLEQEQIVADLVAARWKRGR